MSEAKKQAIDGIKAAEEAALATRQAEMKRTMLGS
jgi:hypothetical protein